MAEARTPDNPAEWLVQVIDGITVYIDPAMAAYPDGLDIRVERFLRWCRLNV